MKNYPYRSGNKIILPKKIGWATSIGARQELHRAFKHKGIDDLVLDMSGAIAVYPNGIVPIISEIDYLRREGADIKVIHPHAPEILSMCRAYGWSHHLSPRQFALPRRERASYSPLASFRSDTELNDEINRVLDVCYQQLVFAPGVPQAFEWALNEIAGNVLVHSETGHGWIQVNTYKESHRLSLIVCDAGVGIPRTMRSRYKIKTDKEAIELAIQKGTTSKPDFGQGNGLAGTLAIAKQSRGQVNITSGGGHFELLNDRVSLRDNVTYLVGTFAQLQLPTDIAIDLPRALWGHTPADYVELKFTNDSGEIVFDPKNYATSFGNRVTGERLRTVVINLIKQNLGKTILVKMSDISVVSSSFADELFGKLFLELGPIDFSSIIKFSGLNLLCKGIINQAILERIGESEFQKREGRMPIPVVQENE